MLMINPARFRSEFRGGVESTLLGLSTTIGPILLFTGFFGASSLPAAFWATVVTATVVPAVWLLFKGHPAIIPSTRTASLATYVALVYQMGIATGDPLAGGPGLSAHQLLVGLAAGSVLFLAASALILLAGLLKFGNIFKMIPSTVTAGISNSIALLLVWLAVKQVVHSTGWATLTVAAMVICLVLWKSLQLRIHALRLIPGVMAAIAAGLAVSLFIEPASTPPTAAAIPDLAWINVRLWPSLLDQGQFLHWMVGGLPGTVTLALVMILESFTATSVMEARYGVRTDANRELIVLGGANMASALLGGVPCTGAPIRSVSSWAAGGRGGPAAVSSWVLTGLVLLALGTWLLALPAGVAAGLLLLQAPLMADPAFTRRLSAMVKARRWHRDGTADLGFWITFVISLVGFFGNLIWGCFLGIGLSCLAVLRRVSSQLTAQWAYLDQYRSRRVRSAGESGNLARTPYRVGVLRLTGHLFFGNSARLSQLIDELNPESVAVVVDVSEVHDVDPSGVDALGWLVRALVERHLTVVLTGLKRTPSAELQQAMGDVPGVAYRIDLDRGLETCEELVLQNATLQAISLVAVPLARNGLLEDMGDDEVTSVLMLGENREVGKGEALFYKDDTADGIWLIEEGTVSILSGRDDDSSRSRLSTLGPGQFVGEMGYIDGKTRSATARADTRVRAMLLDKQAIAALMARQPEAGLKITRNIARELSHRVRNRSSVQTEAASPGWSSNSPRARPG